MTREATQDPVHYSDWLTLLGFQGEAEAQQHVQGQGVVQITTADEWLSQIKAARDAVSKLTGRLTVQPSVKEFGPEFDARFTQLKSDPTFPEHLIGMKSNRFAMVELAKLHCFQLNVNMEYVDSLVARAPEPSDLPETVKFCLPTRDEVGKTAVIASFNPNTNTFAAVTQNLDFRVAGQMQGEDPITHRAFSGFIYGGGLPQMSVVEYKGMFILKNGYHRAVALLRKKHEFLPCLLLSTDGFQFTGGQAQGFMPIDTIMSDRSPVLADFLSPAAILVPRRRLRLMITVHSEAQIIPV